MPNKLAELEKTINYEFRNKQLLLEAVTHSSYVREHHLERVKSNERLEFLGDALLDAVAGEALYLRLPDAEEGKLTKFRAAVVCEKTLSTVGNELGIGKFLYMGNGEIKQGGRYRDSILADTIEALIGAMFLDSGYEEVRRFVCGILDKYMEEAIAGRLVKDYKSAIQELLQGKGAHTPSYNVTKEEGPDHNKTFYVDLTIDGAVYGSGSGHTKKQAEQNAAKQALERGNLKNVF